jgi:hypothetical protein
LAFPRRRYVPLSCVGLNLDKAFRELVSNGGNVSAAARKLGVPVSDFRLLTRAKPELIDAALEAHEQALDKAEAVILKALHSKDAGRAFEAAKTILRFSTAARRRGWYVKVRRQEEETTDPSTGSAWLDPKAS